MLRRRLRIQQTHILIRIRRRLNNATNRSVHAAQSPRPRMLRMRHHQQRHPIRTRQRMRRTHLIQTLRQPHPPRRPRNQIPRQRRNRIKQPRINPQSQRQIRIRIPINRQHPMPIPRPNTTHRPRNRSLPRTTLTRNT
jgi:hypothetical protein